MKIIKSSNNAAVDLNVVAGEMLNVEHALLLFSEGKQIATLETAEPYTVAGDDDIEYDIRVCAGTIYFVGRIPAWFTKGIVEAITSMEKNADLLESREHQPLNKSTHSSILVKTNMRRTVINTGNITVGNIDRFINVKKHNFTSSDVRFIWNVRMFSHRETKYAHIDKLNDASLTNIVYGIVFDNNNNIKLEHNATMLDISEKDIVRGDLIMNNRPIKLCKIIHPLFAELNNGMAIKIGELGNVGVNKVYEWPAEIPLEAERCQFCSGVIFGDYYIIVHFELSRRANCAYCTHKNRGAWGRADNSYTLFRARSPVTVMNRILTVCGENTELLDIFMQIDESCIFVNKAMVLIGDRYVGCKNVMDYICSPYPNSAEYSGRKILSVVW